MTDMIAALTLLGAPAAALFALRCAVQHQFRKERAGYPYSWSAVSSSRPGWPEGQRRSR